MYNIILIPSMTATVPPPGAKEEEADIQQMKTAELVKILQDHGFTVKHGAKHDLWTHPDGRRTTLPRHSQDIPTGTLKAILKQVQITL